MLLLLVVVVVVPDVDPWNGARVRKVREIKKPSKTSLMIKEENAAVAAQN